jgi:hypothetical protein
MSKDDIEEQFQYRGHNPELILDDDKSEAALSRNMSESCFQTPKKAQRISFGFSMQKDGLKIEQTHSRNKSQEQKLKDCFSPASRQNSILGRDSVSSS